VSDYEPASELSRSTQPWVAPSNVEQLAAWDGDAGARRAHRSGRPGRSGRATQLLDTEFFRDQLTGQRRDALIAANFTGRAGIPEDVAGAVAFLASSAARQITGQVLAVNGGARATR
jgi:3-oxoacyl-[acyl-carrier protein] reductase